eukprot:m.53853 g.53853  ORF g.53853 m.53853 type:complete len:78 (-) comp10884_c0_seq2:501-734(-)
MSIKMWDAPSDPLSDTTSLFLSLRGISGSGEGIGSKGVSSSKSAPPSGKIMGARMSSTMLTYVANYMAFHGSIVNCA